MYITCCGQLSQEPLIMLAIMIYLYTVMDYNDTSVAYMYHTNIHDICFFEMS